MLNGTVSYLIGALIMSEVRTLRVFFSADCLSLYPHTGLTGAVLYRGVRRSKRGWGPRFGACRQPVLCQQRPRIPLSAMSDLKFRPPPSRYRQHARRIRSQSLRVTSVLIATLGTITADRQLTACFA